MRVLLDVSAVPDQPVGAGVYTVQLARELARVEHLELHLLSRAGDARRWRDLAPGAPVHAEVPANRPTRLVWEQVRAPRLADELALDVWHGPHYTMPARVTTPAVVTIHDLTFFDHPEWHERGKVLFFRQMIRVSARRARALVAVSERTATRLRAVVAPVAPVLVVPHGVDHDRFRPGPLGDPADLDALRAIGVRPPYVAFAGVVEPRKGIPTLVDAFARIARDRPELRLVLAGHDGWGMVAVRDAVERSGVASRVLRPGYVPSSTVPALFRQAVVVAYPSFEEGFGLPALEAMACGAPLVSTTGSAIEEVVGDAALLVPPGDPTALAGALDTALRDDAVADRLRRAGPVRAAPYTWVASAAGHLDAYRIAAGIAA